MSSPSTSLQNCNSCSIQSKIKFKIPQGFREVEVNPRETVEEIVQKTCLADNEDTDTEKSDKSGDEDERPELKFNFENPQQLDLRGLDWQFTYRMDEQDLELAKEYRIMKRELEKQELKRTEPEKYEQKKRDEKFKLPDLYNLKVGFDEKEEPVEDLGVDLSLCEVFEETPKEEKEEVKEVKETDFELVKTEQKPHNLLTLQKEAERRLKNLHERLDKIEEKDQEIQKLKLEKEKEFQENLATILGQQDFEELLAEKKEVAITPKFPQISRAKHKYPKTIKELPKLRRRMLKEEREIYVKAKLKQEILEELGVEIKPKNLPPLAPVRDQLSLDEGGSDEFSEQYSDSDDGMSVGYATKEKFKLRGFHDLLSSEPRGLRIHGKWAPVHTCMTREEWVQSIFRIGEKPKTMRQVKCSNPDDERFNIFEKPWKYKRPKNVESPVKQYITGKKAIIEKPVEPKFRVLKEPKTKRFNLIKFLYDNEEKEGKEETEEFPNEVIERPKVAPTIFQEIHMNAKKEQCERRYKRHQRLKIMGIPFKEIESSENSVEKDSIEEKSEEEEDWVPKPEPLESTIVKEKNPVNEDKMQAPDFREPTLRVHPRRPRIYDGGSDLDVPRMEKVTEDIVHETNLDELKFENIPFKQRFHHEHRNHAQTKLIRIRYAPKLQEFEGDEWEKCLKKEEKEKIKVEFPLMKDVDRNLDWSRVAGEINEENPGDGGEKVLKIDHAEDQTIFSDKSTPSSAFQKFLTQKFKQHLKPALGGEKYAPYEFKDKEAYRQQILKEQESIASCLTSASSSNCTNFTNDSGSYFKIMNRKVPLDYLLKYEVPCTGNHENHLKAEMVKQRDEYFGPYFVVPHAGQGIEMKEICQAKDRFYTQRTRRTAGLKDRLKMEPLNVYRVGKEKKHRPRLG